MNVKLTREQEQIIKDELKAGHFRSVEEVVARALEALKHEARLRASADGENKGTPSQEDAVREMLAFVEKNHVRLSGVSVKDLIHEGHRL